MIYLGALIDKSIKALRWAGDAIHETRETMALVSERLSETGVYNVTQIHAPWNLLPCKIQMPIFLG